MATIAPCRYSEAEGLVKQVYEEILQAYKAAYKIKEPFGHYQIMGHTPEFLAASWPRARYVFGGKPDNMDASLSRFSLQDKHCVTLGISATNNCEYCVRLHTARLENFGMTSEELVELMMVVDVVNGYASFAEGVRAGDRPTLDYSDETRREETNMHAFTTVYDPIRKAYGDREPEEIFRLMGHRPDYLRASWERSRLCFFEEGSLGLRTKHMVAFGVAAVKSCDHSIREHTKHLKALGLDDEDLVELLLVVDVVCGYNRYVQGLQITGDLPSSS